MSRRMRAYYYASVGAIGGLLGWQVSNLLGLSFVKPLFLSEAVVGALIGLCVGLLIGAAEGLMTRNWTRALRAGGFSGLLGLAAGAAGVALAGVVFPAIGAGTLGRGPCAGRAVGWLAGRGATGGRPALAGRRLGGQGPRHGPAGRMRRSLHRADRRAALARLDRGAFGQAEGQ